MLLSRTASDVYWFGRHLERAESIARVVDQHTSMLVDLPVDIEADWSVLLGVTGATDSFAERYDTHDEGRIIAFTLALAGSLARQKRRPVTEGTMPTHTPLFATLLTGIVLVLAALTFFPALALGPLAEALS